MRKVERPQTWDEKERNRLDLVSGFYVGGVWEMGKELLETFLGSLWVELPNMLILFEIF